MINLILIFPLVACVLLFIFKKKFLNNLMINIYAILHLVVTFILCYAPDFLKTYQSTRFFAVDDINKIFMQTLSIVFMAVSIYNNGYIKSENSPERMLRHYTYMLLIFVFSMTGAILSTNLGVTWIFIEGTTLASAYLIYFNKTKHSIEAAWKYVFICSIGIALAFVGIILLTASTGSLNSLFYSDLYSHANEFNTFWLKFSFVFILFGIGTKMGLAPVHFWLPDAHAESPAPISALLSAALLNSAFLMILKVFKITILASCDGYARIMLIVMGFISIFVAAVFIYHISNYKRLLAYSSIENMGILAIGTALGGLGTVAAFIHLIGHSLVKSAFFMTSGNILRIYGTKEIKSVNALMNRDKTTGFLWMASFLAISAFPPSVLFISEFMIIKTMIIKNNYVSAVIFLFLLTVILYGMGRAIINMCFGGENSEFKLQKLPLVMYIPQLILLLAAFLAGIYMPENITQMIVNSASGF